jgi:hypothetical protein
LLKLVRCGGERVACDLLLRSTFQLMLSFVYRKPLTMHALNTCSAGLRPPTCTRRGSRRLSELSATAISINAESAGATLAMYED